MKKVIFACAFSLILTFGSAVQAIMVKDKNTISFSKGDDKKKKKKSCEGSSKGSCTKGSKSCTGNKEASVQ